MTQSPLLRRLCIRPPNPNKGQMTLNKRQTKTKKKKLNTVFMFLKTQNKNSNQTNFTIKKSYKLYLTIKVIGATSTT
jgi:hypothetical protein